MKSLVSKNKGHDTPTPSEQNENTPRVESLCVARHIQTAK